MTTTPLHSLPPLYPFQTFSGERLIGPSPNLARVSVCVGVCVYHFLPNGCMLVRASYESAGVGVGWPWAVRPGAHAMRVALAAAI